MIPRYSRPKMDKVWSTQNRFQIWFEIEAHAADAQAELGVIPKSAAKAIWKYGKFQIDRINEIEKETKHDVIAFLTNIGENVGKEARYLHQGMTSSDIIDTSFSIQISQATDLLIKEVKALLKVLKKRAFENKLTLCIGRSHGIHAEITTFGLKLASFYAEFNRALQRLKSVKKEISICAISGAVGTYANIDPFVEEYVAKQFNLNVETISTQIIPRDRHAVWFANLGIIASSIERVATEIRNLQKTEVREVEEFFEIGQKGSSAMPHKRNPVLSENLTGISRIIRSYVIPSMENIALWHERDISHSSVERVLAPDISIALDFSLARLTGIMENLIVYPENMTKNLRQLKGLIHSQQVLLKLTQSGFSREEAYLIVQNEAMKVWNNQGNFFDLLLNNETIKEKVKEKELKEIFDESLHLKNVEFIFQRVFSY